MTVTIFTLRIIHNKPNTSKIKVHRVKRKIATTTTTTTSSAIANNTRLYDKFRHKTLTNRLPISVSVVKARFNVNSLHFVICIVIAVRLPLHTFFHVYVRLFSRACVCVCFSFRLLFLSFLIRCRRCLILPFHFNCIRTNTHECFKNILLI